MLTSHSCRVRKELEAVNNGSTIVLCLLAQWIFQNRSQRLVDLSWSYPWQSGPKSGCMFLMAISQQIINYLCWPQPHSYSIWPVWTHPRWWWGTFSWRSPQRPQAQKQEQLSHHQHRLLKELKVLSLFPTSVTKLCLLHIPSMSTEAAIGIPGSPAGGCLMNNCSSTSKSQIFADLSNFHALHGIIWNEHIAEHIMEDLWFVKATNDTITHLSYILYFCDLPHWKGLLWHAIPGVCGNEDPAVSTHHHDRNWGEK